jgi:hypothetical protein
MSERNLKLLKGNETGFGLLIEYDGYINPNDEKNKEVLEKIKNDRTPENYGKTEFPLELYVILQKADTLNHNGRIYPYNILKKKVDLYKELISQYMSGGENEHPDNANVAIDRISHRITDIWWEGKTVVGKILIYVTLGFVKYGVVSSEVDKIALLLSYGHRVGVSSRTLGAGEGDEMITAHADKSDMSGYPLLEENFSYKSVTDKTTLQQHANSEIKRVQTPIEILDVTIRANDSSAPTIGDFEVGDWAKFTFADWFFQPSYSQFMRIVEYNVSVDNQGLEEIDFTLNTERDETYDDETEDNG